METLVPPRLIEITSPDNRGSSGSVSVIDVIEGKRTALRCIAHDSKPKTDLEWIVDGKTKYYNTNIAPTIKKNAPELKKKP